MGVDRGRWGAFLSNNCFAPGKWQGHAEKLPRAVAEAAVLAVLAVQEMKL